MSAPSAAPDPPTVARWAPWLLAAALAGLGFVPWMWWLPGGREDATAPAVLSAWASGTAIAAGAGVVLAILDRRLEILARRPWRPLVAAAERRPLAFGLAVAALATIAYATIATLVFDRQPLLIDEIVQALQARIFTEGRLWRPAGAEPAFFSIPLVADRGGRVFGQFPPGWPALLLPFELAHARWLAGPVSGGASVLATWWWLRLAEPRPSVRALALLLAAGAPFFAFQAGTQMNHAPATAALMLGLAGTAHAALGAASGRRRAAALAGLGFGLAATIRPVDAACLAAPALTWLAWRAWRAEGRAAWRGPAAMIAAMAAPTAAMLAFNAATTGEPLTFGYTFHWGPLHTIGFHDSPYHVPHTPRDGLELAGAYVFRLNRVLFEWIAPGLLPTLLALALHRPGDRDAAALDAVALVGSGLLLAAYFAYFHDGWYLGPRFLVPLVPVLALWTARAVPAARARLGRAAGDALTWGMLVAAGAGAAVVLPVEWHNYRQGLQTMRLDGTALARSAGVRGGLVFVRESWGATLLARLWGRGLFPGDVEWLYKRADQCRLEEAVGRLEASGTRGAAAWAALAPLAADSTVVRPFPALRDRSGRVDPARPLTEACRAQVARERAGYTHLAPRLLDGGDNIFARDLGGRDTLLLDAHPGRPVYLLAPTGPDEGAPLRFFPVDAEALRRDARAAAAASR